MGYDFVALPIETGGHQSEEAEQFLDRLVKYAGSGDSSAEARFRHFAATSVMMTNQIGVARAILANLPLTRHSQDRGRPLLGYVPLAPLEQPGAPSHSSSHTRGRRKGRSARRCARECQGVC